MSNPLRAESKDDFSGGMVLDRLPHALAKNESAFLVDTLLHDPGNMRTRGPYISDALRIGSATISADADKFMDYLTKRDGSAVVLNISSTNSTDYISTITSNGTYHATGGSLSWTKFPTGFRAARDMDGGLWVTGFYDTTPDNILFYWMGGYSGSTAGTITTLTTSKSVVGVGTSFTTMTQGTFLFDATTASYIGTVDSIQSDTALTLVDPAYFAAAGATHFSTGIRPFYGHLSGGTVTARTSQTTVVGSSTNFRQKNGTLQFNMFAYNADNPNTSFVGTSSAIASGTTLTLGAAATNDVDNVDWFGTYIYTAGNKGVINNAAANYTYFNPGRFAYPGSGLGAIGAAFGGRMWFGNMPTSPVGAAASPTDASVRVYYSGTRSAEDIDLSEKGSFLTIPGDTGDNTIVDMFGFDGGLLVFKPRSTWIIRGTTPASFTVTKLCDNGIVSPMSVCYYNGGIVWASLDGMYFFDGRHVPENVLLNKCSNWWVKNVSSKYSVLPGTASFYPTLTTWNNYLIYSHNGALANISWGSTASTSRYAFTVYMPNRACGFWSNTLFASTTKVNNLLYAPMSTTGLATTAGAATFTSVAKLLRIDSIFDYAGADGAYNSVDLQATTGIDLYTLRSTAANIWDTGTPWGSGLLLSASTNGGLEAKVRYTELGSSGQYRQYNMGRFTGTINVPVGATTSDKYNIYMCQAPQTDFYGETAGGERPNGSGIISIRGNGTYTYTDPTSGAVSGPTVIAGWVAASTNVVVIDAGTTTANNKFAHFFVNGTFQQTVSTGSVWWGEFGLGHVRFTGTVGANGWSSTSLKMQEYKYPGLYVRTVATYSGPTQMRTRYIGIKYTNFNSELQARVITNESAYTTAVVTSTAAAKIFSLWSYTYTLATKSDWGGPSTWAVRLLRNWWLNQVSLPSVTAKLPVGKKADFFEIELYPKWGVDHDTRISNITTFFKTMRLGRY